MRVRWLVRIIILSAIFWFYQWTATHGLFFSWGTKGYYNLLADAFLNGQLNLLINPPEELLTLADPYDPNQNQSLRFHDASLYKGKYYLYFGITPSIIFMTFRWLNLGDFPESLAVVLFLFLTLLVALGLFKKILEEYGLKFPIWMEGLVILALSLNSGFPFVLRRSLHYEVAIACGLFCFMLSMYFSNFWSKDCEWKNSSLFVTGLFLGLAIGARPVWVLATPLLFIISYWIMIHDNRLNKKTKIAPLAIMWTSFLVILCLVGFYNYLRFESWTEFGLTYQLASFHPQKTKQFTPTALIPGLYYFILQPLTFNWTFPFIHAIPQYPGILLEEYIKAEPIAGILPIAPLNYILFVPLFLFAAKKCFPQKLIIIFQKRIFPLNYFLYLTITGLMQILFLSLRPGVTMRYILDFSSLLILGSLLVWVFLIQNNNHKAILKNLFIFGGAAAIFYSSLINIAISLTGYYDSFRRFNPAHYEILKNAIQSHFLWLAQPLMKANHTILGITNPNGLEEDESGRFFWLGDKEALIEIYSKKDGPAKFMAFMVPGPSINRTGERHFRIRINSIHEIEEKVSEPSWKVIILYLKKGVNIISLQSLDMPDHKNELDDRILILRIQNLRLEQCKLPTIVEIDNPNGLEINTKGREFFWLGTEETKIKIMATQDGCIILRGNFVPGPDLPETTIRRIRIRTSKGYEKSEIFIGKGERDILIPVEKGANLISIKSIDQVTHRLIHDPRDLLVKIQDLRVYDTLHWKKRDN